MVELKEKAINYAEENVITVLKEAFARVYADGYRDGYKDHKDEILPLSQKQNDKEMKEAEEGDGLETMTGMEVKTSDEVRMVPDILQNGDEFFFPVFSSAEEMGEYGDSFSKVQMHFLEAANLARNNEKNVTGIVINAFSEPFVIRKESFELIADIQSSVEEGDSDEQSED